MSTPPSSSARQARVELGERLREIRRDAGFTARALAAATNQHYTRVSKLENGVKAPSDQDIRTWCEACGATEQIPDLIATARAVESAYLEVQRQARSGMKRVHGPHTPDLYERTRTFRIYEHNVIPGLIQTRDYTAAMLRFWIEFLGTPNDIEAALDVRAERGQVLHRGAHQFAIVLEEQVLRTWFGTAAVQAAQLQHLLTVMVRPNVSIGIIPLMRQRTGVPSAPFWIFDQHLVALETPTASIEVTRPSEIDLYERMFTNLQQAALYGDDARQLIRAVLGELQQ